MPLLLLEAQVGLHPASLRFVQGLELLLPLPGHLLLDLLFLLCSAATLLLLLLDVALRNKHTTYHDYLEGTNQIDRALFTYWYKHLHTTGSVLLPQ